MQKLQIFAKDFAKEWPFLAMTANAYAQGERTLTTDKKMQKKMLIFSECLL